MKITDIINNEIPNFSGIFVCEGSAILEKIRDFKVTLAWKFNKNRGEKFHKVLVAGNNESRGLYFIADIEGILSVKQLSEIAEFKNVIDFHNERWDNWISRRVNGEIFDNTLDERFAIIFSNPTEIKRFTETKIEFLGNPVGYIYGRIADKMFDEAIGERLQIRNIGKISNAEIKLNGLTVIAGENDTGKSTVGKLIFSIVKAMSRYEQELNEGKIQNISKKIEKLYFSLRQAGVFNDDNFRNQFHPNIFLKQISQYIEKNQLHLFSEEEITEHIETIFKYKYQLLDEVKLTTENDNYVKLLNDIKKSIFSKEDKQEQIKRALNNALFSEFYSEISPKGLKNKSVVNYLSGNINILNFEIENNKITTLSLTDDLVFQDIIFIETPLLLQMYNLISNSDTLFEEENNEFKNPLNRRPKISLHIKDLITKIEAAKYFSGNFFENNAEQIDILKKISTIINGGYTFEQNEKDFVFSKKTHNKSNVKIKPTNTASGIKSFGIIQLLIQANMLNDRSLLVIDEPENHLHPEWQIKYAEMIVELVKSDISVIISSHSPYMIQALKHFSEKGNLKRKTSYYIAEINGNEQFSTISEVTTDLNKIFSKLAKPLKDIVWQ